MWQIIQKYLGWRNWAVFRYNSIFENLFVILYIMLRQQNFSGANLLDILLFLLFSVFSTSYGYLINDFSDVDLDRRHGKPNTFANQSKGSALVVLLIVVLISALLAWRFIENKYFPALWIVWLVISTCYSLPPLRLKERGRLGLFFVVLAQRFLPILIVFAVFQFSEIWEMILLGVYVFFRGASSDLNHQLEDYFHDRKTATQTSAVVMGAEHGRRLLQFFLEMEKWLLAAIIIVSLFRFSYLDIPIFAFLVLMSILYLGALLFSYIQVIRTRGAVDVNPFHGGEKNIFQFLHHAYPSVILALGLNLIVMRYNFLFTSLLIIQLLLRQMFSIQVIRQSFIFQSLKKALVKG